MVTTVEHRTSHGTSPPHLLGRVVRRAVRSTAYGAALLPLGLASTAVAVAGRPHAAVPWWTRIRTALAVPPGAPAPPSAARPSVPTMVRHAVLSLLLGVVALIPLGFLLLFVLRGVLYGVVTDGPHTHDWGGPTLAGAWAAHLAVGVALAAVGLVMLSGLTALHGRLSGELTGDRVARWVVPMSVAVSVPAVVFVVLWSRQV